MIDRKTEPIDQTKVSRSKNERVDFEMFQIENFKKYV